MRTLIAASLLAAIALPGLPLPASAFPSPVSGSYYHHKFEGRTMACGGRFDNEGLTAASNHHPCGSHVRVSYRDRSVVVRITDRCGRCGIDLTRAAARELGMLRVGRAPVQVERLTGGGLEAVGYAPAEVEEAAYRPSAGDGMAGAAVSAVSFNGSETGDSPAASGDAAGVIAATAAEPAVAPAIETTPTVDAGPLAAPAAVTHVGAVPTGAIEAYSQPHAN